MNVVRSVAAALKFARVDSEHSWDKGIIPKAGKAKAFLSRSKKKTKSEGHNHHTVEDVLAGHGVSIAEFNDSCA